MASGWNLWVWLECIGVVSGCSCKLLAIFLAAASLPLCSFLKCFFVLVNVIFVQHRKRCSKNIRDRSKTEITRI